MTLDKKFWKETAERAGKSAAQSIVLTVTSGVAAGAAGAGQVNAFLLDFPTIGGFALGAALLSVLTSIISAPIGGDGPSLVRSGDHAA